MFNEFLYYSPITDTIYLLPLKPTGGPNDEYEFRVQGIVIISTLYYIGEV